MKVVDRKPVPIYEAECSECHSKIEYKASEVSFTGYITCPVCGKSIWGSTRNPVRMDSEENGVPSAQPEISRIEQELHGKTPEEQYKFLYWLMLKFALTYTDSRLAVIEWLKGEK